MDAEAVSQHRHHQIGAVLLQARLRQKRTVTDCAALLKTSRRRYAAIERGEVAVSYVEMEQLISYLQISEIPDAPKIFTTGARQVVVEELLEEIVVRMTK